MGALPNTAQQQNPKKRTHYCYSNLFFSPFNATGWQFQIKAAVALNLFSLHGCGFPRSDALSCHLTRLEKAQWEHSQTFDGNANNGPNYVFCYACLDDRYNRRYICIQLITRPFCCLVCHSMFTSVRSCSNSFTLYGDFRSNTDKNVGRWFWFVVRQGWIAKVIWWRMTLPSSMTTRQSSIFVL